MLMFRMCPSVPPDIGPRLSPSWTSWTRTSSRAGGGSSTRAAEESASWTRTGRRSGGESRGSWRPAWSQAKRTTRVSHALWHCPYSLYQHFRSFQKSSPLFVLLLQSNLYFYDSFFFFCVSLRRLLKRWALFNILVNILFFFCVWRIVFLIKKNRAFLQELNWADG